MRMTQVVALVAGVVALEGSAAAVGRFTPMGWGNQQNSVYTCYAQGYNTRESCTGMGYKWCADYACYSVNGTIPLCESCSWSASYTYSSLGPMLRGDFIQYQRAVGDPGGFSIAGLLTKLVYPKLYNGYLMIHSTACDAINGAGGCSTIWNSRADFDLGAPTSGSCSDMKNFTNSFPVAFNNLHPGPSWTTPGTTGDSSGRPFYFRPTSAAVSTFVSNSYNSNNYGVMYGGANISYSLKAQANYYRYQQCSEAVSDAYAMTGPSTLPQAGVNVTSQQLQSWGYEGRGMLGWPHPIPKTAPASYPNDLNVTKVGSVIYNAALEMIKYGNALGGEFWLPGFPGLEAQYSSALRGALANPAVLISGLPTFLCLTTSGYTKSNIESMFANSVVNDVFDNQSAGTAAYTGYLPTSLPKPGLRGSTGTPMLFYSLGGGGKIGVTAAGTGGDGVCSLSSEGNLDTADCTGITVTNCTPKTQAGGYCGGLACNYYYADGCGGNYWCGCSGGT